MINIEMMANPLKSKGLNGVKYDDTIFIEEARALIMSAYRKGRFVKCVSLNNDGSLEDMLLKKKADLHKLAMEKEKAFFARNSFRANPFVLNVVRVKTFLKGNLFGANVFSTAKLNVSNVVYLKVNGTSYKVLRGNRWGRFERKCKLPIDLMR